MSQNNLIVRLSSSFLYLVFTVRFHSNVRDFVYEIRAGSTNGRLMPILRMERNEQKVQEVRSKT